MFYDIAKIKMKAGDGGNGVVSFRHERYKAKGGPDGGDGGRGGSVSFKADSSLGTLVFFITKKNFFAKNGGNGGKNDRHGKNGEELILEVPLGTMVFDNKTNELLYDLSEDNEIVEVAKGGRGGFGNAHFATSTNQAPQMVELGEPGEESELRLELKLVADVAIIGIPSSGKSTLISVVSNAKPKIADYPFTTIIPNLGVAAVDNFSFVVVDVPGLIKDAYLGKGLGDKFLRHIERSRLVVHLLDITSPDIVGDYKTIRNELKMYNSALLKKPEVVAINKIDTIEKSKVKSQKSKLEKELRKITKTPLFFISSVTKEGINNLLFKIVKELKLLKRPVFVTEKKKVFKPAERLLRSFEISKESGVYIVTGRRLERLASQTNPDNTEAVARLQRVISASGLIKGLERMKIKDGYKIKIGKRTGRFEDGRIIIIA